jgi:hypothetical protein
LAGVVNGAFLVVGAMAGGSYAMAGSLME